MKSVGRLYAFLRSILVKHIRQMGSNASSAKYHLKCAVCSKVLSRGPIKVNIKHGSIVCGRCPNTNTIASVQIENILKEIQLPCSYSDKGCSTSVKFGDVGHETICAYIWYKCPSMVDCAWEGLASDVYEHFDNVHKNFVLQKAEFNIDTSLPVRRNFMIRVKKNVVLLQVIYDPAPAIKSLLFRAAYFPLGEEVLLKYKVRLSDVEDKAIFILADQSYKCVIFNTLYDLKLMTKFEIQKYLEGFNNAKAIKITIDFE